MSTTVRPRTTGSVALASAAMIAATPLLAPPGAPAVDIPDAVYDVDLTSLSDPIGPWVDTLDHAVANITGLFNAWDAAPFAAAQQLAVNQIAHLDALLDNPLVLGGVLQDAGAHLLGALGAPSGFVPFDHLVSLPIGTSTGAAFLGGNEVPFLTMLAASLLSGDPLQAGVIGFSGSPLSGLLLGAAGPVISPVVALADDLQSAIGALTSTDPLAALDWLVDIPAHMTDAFLNGEEYLDLTSLITPLLNAVMPPLGGAFPSVPVGLQMGGLLSGPSGLLDAGTLFGALDTPTASMLHGAGVGPIGALLELPQAIAVGLGWNPAALIAGGGFMPLDVFGAGPFDLALLGPLANLLDIPGLLLNGLLMALS